VLRHAEVGGKLTDGAEGLFALAGRLSHNGRLSRPSLCARA
jgi:hypothetical protein